MVYVFFINFPVCLLSGMETDQLPTELLLLRSNKTHNPVIIMNRGTRNRDIQNVRDLYFYFLVITEHMMTRLSTVTSRVQLMALCFLTILSNCL